MAKRQSWCDNCGEWFDRADGMCNRCQMNLFESKGQTRLPFRVATSPLAKRGDPATSHESAEAMLMSDEIGRLQLMTLQLVKKFPGLGANEYSHIATGNWESKRFPRRMSELRDCRKPAPGYLFNHGTKKCPHSRMTVMLWFPIEMEREVAQGWKPRTQQHKKGLVDY